MLLLPEFGSSFEYAKPKLIAFHTQCIIWWNPLPFSPFSQLSIEQANEANKQAGSIYF